MRNEIQDDLPFILGFFFGGLFTLLVFILMTMAVS